jgi:ATP-binding cassette subfamily B protein RaxB
MSDELHLGLFRRSKVRLIRQTEVSECGLACLAMVASYHGLDVDLGTLRREYRPSLRGASLRSLMATADQMGLAPGPVKLPLEAVARLEMPAILHWNLNHFVVVERVERQRALIHDPARGSAWYPLADISPHFTGVALELRPTADFAPGERRERLRLTQLWRRITGLKRALLQTAVLSLVMQAVVLLLPYYTQLAIDSVLPAEDRDLLTILALGFGLLTLLHVAASLLRSFVLLAAGTSLSFGIASNMARRLFRLPVPWFERRHVGDVLSRFQSIAPIRHALTQGAVAAAVDGTLAVFTLLFMFFYSAKLALVALIAFAVYLIVRWISFPLEWAAREEAIVAGAKEQSMMIETLRGIVTLRLFNREGTRHALWQGRLTQSVNADVGFQRIGLWQAAAKTLVFGVEFVVSIWMAVGLVMSGGFSVGMLFAYLAYKTQFLTNAASLLDQAMTFRMLGLHLERLSDVALSEEDAGFGPSSRAQTELRGRVELRQVSFRYSPADPVILENIDLIVEPGEHIAITGPSGGGKSTLVKILLGLAEPDSGEVLIDSLPLSRFGHRSYRDQAAAVLQEDSLFAGSLAENIALFDEAPDLDAVVRAATAAAIHEDIMRMPMAYDTLVGDMGSALSGGQKQRILLARALYRRPKLLILDEGTSHLDSVHERAVNSAIAELGITRIVVAHRQETIRSATRVYALEHRRLREITEASAAQEPA